MSRELLLGVGTGPAVVRDALLGGRALCVARALGAGARAARERGAAHGAVARAARHRQPQLLSRAQRRRAGDVGARRGRRTGTGTEDSLAIAPRAARHCLR